MILDKQDTRGNTESTAELPTLAMTLAGPQAEATLDPLDDVIMCHVISTKVLD